MIRQTSSSHRPGPIRVVLGLFAPFVVLLGACQAPAAVEAGLFPDGWPYADGQPAVESVSGMVVTTDRYASEVGAGILEAGGNAVDAAIATHFALAVVNPEAGNIGGGGFMVVRMANGDAAALDFREKAPLAASRDMFLDEGGNLTDRSVVGHLAAGVPGSVQGMWDAHQRYGTLAWEALVQPAIDLAMGVVVTDRIHKSIANQHEALQPFAGSVATFLPRGAAPPIGDTFTQGELSRTLTRIRDEGPDDFYRGRTAELIVAEMNRGGGIMTHEDLAQYTTAWRDPVVFDYRGHTVLSMPPSSSGGVTLAEIANLLEGFTLSSMEWHGAEHVHLLAEAWKRAYADRNEYLADPDFVEMPMARLTSDEYAAERRAGLSMERATPSLEVGPGIDLPEESENTTHYSIVDGDGNAVSVTTTINSWFGSKVTVTGAGFLLNNEMDDFAAKPGTPNQFGLVQGENNAIEPGKRMLSAMTPTVVLDSTGRLLMVVGTPGGATIITTVFQVLSNVIDFGMNVPDAVAAPRVHHQHLPDQITIEHGGIVPDVIAQLEALGHTVVLREVGPPDAYFGGGLSGDVQAIVVGADGVLHGYSDQRRGGAAVGN